MNATHKQNAKIALAQLYANKNNERAKSSLRFFKTKKGEYGEGDRFIGVTVPMTRLLAKEFITLSLDEISILLSSPIHEARLLGLIILVEQYKRSQSKNARKNICTFYLKNLHRINNWDLVDTSAHHILGGEIIAGQYSFEKVKKMALSPCLWERRISIIATYACILQGSEKETYEVSSILLHDEHDLIQKAVGWMLREVGKRIEKKLLKNFLEVHANEMPRTMLRYAIEHFSDSERKYFLEKKLS